MEIFQFLKYLDDFDSGKISNPIVQCFDLEDSVQHLQAPEQNGALKARARTRLHAVLDTFRKNNTSQTTAVRVNTHRSREYQQDLALLAEFRETGFVFLPKTETADQVLECLKDLQAAGLQTTQLIPVIETCTGMRNLPQMISRCSAMIRRFAFGHCDYNFDAGIFPFLHQQHREYWNWIEHMAALMQSRQLTLVHSPVLRLNDTHLFRSALSHLHRLTRGNAGQITLTGHQSKLALEFDPEKPLTPEPLKYRLRDDRSDQEAAGLREEFEMHHAGKSFAVTQNRVLIAPQEYVAACHLLDAPARELRFAFMGGCFPVQGGICYENLFHQLLRKKMEHQYAVRWATHIERYETIASIEPRAAAMFAQHPPDVVVCCLRPEPVLRLAQFGFRYHTGDGASKWMFHFRGKPLNQEFFEEHPVRFASNNLNHFGAAVRKNGWMHRLNAWLGYIMGNHHAAIRRYFAALEGLREICNLHHTPLIIMAPLPRSDNRLNLRISTLLRRRMAGMLQQDGFNMTEFDVGADAGMTLEGGIYASEQFHAITATRLAGKIREVITLQNKMAAPPLVGTNAQAIS